MVSPTQVAAQNTKRPKLEFHTLEHIRNDNSEPPPPIIENGVLLKRTQLLMYGAPKSKKTFLALNMALAMVTGKDFAGFRITRPQRVMVVSAEGGYFPTRKRMQTMLESLGSEYDQNLRIATAARINLLDDSIELLENEIRQFKPDVLILDPLIKFHSADENSSQEMGKVMSVIRELMESFDLSVILVHHKGKNLSGGARGSSAITGEYDSCIEIAEDDGKYNLTFDMRHVETPQDRQIIFNNKTFWFESPEDDPIRKVLQQPMRKKNLVDVMVSEYGIGKTTAYNKVRDAIAAGAVAKLEDRSLIFKN